MLLAFAGLATACGRVGFTQSAEDERAVLSPEGGPDAGDSGGAGRGTRDAAANLDGAAGSANTGGSTSAGGAAGASTMGSGGTDGGDGGMDAAADASTGTADAGTGGASDVTDVSSGEGHTCALSNGVPYCWGNNTDRALGGFVGSNTGTPQHVIGSGSTGGFTAVTAGVYYGCALHTSGSVACWGKNDAGQLATGDTTDRPTPTTVTLPAAARAISGESGTTCALLVDGTLWCWGMNTEGQAGQNELPPFGNLLAPARVPSTEAWLFVGTGQGHVCAIRSPGSLYCWGRNTWGQIGQGSTNPGQFRAPTRVGKDSDWRRVTAGQGSTCGLRGPGSLWCWGDNGAGQLGQDDTVERDAPVRVGTADDWTDVSVDTFHTCGIRKPGTLWCWGRNVEGQLGVGDYAIHGVPTQVGTRTDWVHASTGRFHTCAVRADDTVWCAGDDPGGQLGNGSFARINAFAQVAPFPP